MRGLLAAQRGGSVPSPFLLLIAFVGLLPATGLGEGRERGRAVRVPRVSLSPPASARGRAAEDGCRALQAAAGRSRPDCAASGKLAVRWGGRLRGGDGASETQEREGLNATAVNSSWGSSPRFAGGGIARQASRTAFGYADARARMRA